MANKVPQLIIAGLSAALLTLGYAYYHETQQPTAATTTVSENSTGLVERISSPAAQAATADLDLSEKRTIELYKRNSDSVVNVTTRSFQYNEFMQLIPREGAGSGFVIDKEGYVVTNFHVVKGAQRFFVAFGNMEESFPAKLVGSDPNNDIAILKVDAPAEMLKPVELGTSSNLQVGQSAVAIGNPFAIGQTMTTGVISSLNRTLQAEEGRIMSGLIQTDAAINQGNSGGPLFDSNGRVIGVNTMIYSPSGGSVGIGFAIPIDTVKRFIPDLIQYGRARHPSLGVSAVPISPRLAEALKLPVKEGLLVMRTVPGSPSHAAGLRGGTQEVYVGHYQLFLGGDIILALDGKKMTSREALVNYLETAKKIGDSLEITYLRNGETQPRKTTAVLNEERR